MMFIKSNLLKLDWKRFTNLSNRSQLIEERTSTFLKAYKLHTTCYLDNKCGPNVGGKHQVTYKPYVPVTYHDHDAKNMGLKRPMSPHLTIYGPTVVAMTSIAQRITGTILVAYAVLISGATLFCSNGLDSLVSLIQSLNLSDGMIKLIKLLLGLPFGFHYFTGIRFCLWNAKKMLGKPEIYKSAFIAIAAGFALSFLFALM